MTLPTDIRRKRQKTRGALGFVTTPLDQAQGMKSTTDDKIVVPIDVFLKIVYNRKVLPLLKDRPGEQVILSSDLFTKMAVAPEDSPENRDKVIHTALVLGSCFGVFLTIAAFTLATALGFTIGQRELFAVLTFLLLFALLGYASVKVHIHKMKPRLVESVEQVADTFTK